MPGHPGLGKYEFGKNAGDPFVLFATIGAICCDPVRSRREAEPRVSIHGSARFRFRQKGFGFGTFYAGKEVC